MTLEIYRASYTGVKLEGVSNPTSFEIHYMVEMDYSAQETENMHNPAKNVANKVGDALKSKVVKLGCLSANRRKWEPIKIN